jgi:hypothetical protein
VEEIEETKQATPEMIKELKVSARTRHQNLSTRASPKFEKVLPKTVRIWSQLTLLLESRKEEEGLDVGESRKEEEGNLHAFGAA